MPVVVILKTNLGKRTTKTNFHPNKCTQFYFFINIFFEQNKKVIKNAQSRERNLSQRPVLLYRLIWWALNR